MNCGCYFFIFFYFIYYRIVFFYVSNRVVKMESVRFGLSFIGFSQELKIVIIKVFILEVMLCLIILYF